MYPDTAEMILEEVRALRQEVAELRGQKEPDHIMFKEAREVLGISDNTLTRRLKQNHVKSYWRNGGKAFDRKHLNRLK